MSRRVPVISDRPPQLLLLGLGGSLFGLLEVGAGLLGLAWVKKADLELEVIANWLSLNFQVHLLMGAAVFFCGLGLLLMREWGRRGMILHAMLSGLWALSFALISTTWVVATWDQNWEQADGSGAVNAGGVAAFVIGAGALIWLALSIMVVWILSRARTREAMNRHDRGLYKRTIRPQ